MVRPPGVVRHTTRVSEPKRVADQKSVRRKRIVPEHAYYGRPSRVSPQEMLAHRQRVSASSASRVARVAIAHACLWVTSQRTAVGFDTPLWVYDRFRTPPQWTYAQGSAEELAPYQSILLKPCYPDPKAEPLSWRT